MASSAVTQSQIEMACSSPQIFFKNLAGKVRSFERALRAFLGVLVELKVSASEGLAYLSSHKFVAKMQWVCNVLCNF